jgi:hypothetical protein
VVVLEKSRGHERDEVSFNPGPVSGPEKRVQMVPVAYLHANA